MTGSDDGHLRLWPLTFKEVYLEAEHEGPVTAVDISGDGSRVMAGTSTVSVKNSSRVMAGTSTVSVKNSSRVTAGTSMVSVKNGSRIMAGTSTLSSRDHFGVRYSPIFCQISHAFDQKEILLSHNIFINICIKRYIGRLFS